MAAKARVLVFLAVLSAAALPAAGGTTVSGSVTITRPAASAKAKPDHSSVVVTLEPAPGTVVPAVTPKSFKIIQQDKRFRPHVLAVPVGSSVSFPNLDPFFHNVFSLFDGKRFDLGLYESGATRSTTFTRPGVCFIFCNIHAEMSAVVFVARTPYYAVTGSSGTYSIPNVAPGRYVVRAWHERAQPAGSSPADLVVSGQEVTVPAIRLVDSGQLSLKHENKYGREYDPPAASPVYK